MRQIARSHFGCCWANKLEGQLRRTTHELQSALRLTVGYLNIYFEL